jgi:hypothetical protein
MTLHERFPTEIQLRHGVTKFPTWHAMVKDGRSA